MRKSWLLTVLVSLTSVLPLASKANCATCSPCVGSAVVFAYR